MRRAVAERCGVDSRGTRRLSGLSGKASNDIREKQQP